jgi:hypothetical protein
MRRCPVGARPQDELHSWARMSPPCVKFWRGAVTRLSADYDNGELEALVPLRRVRELALHLRSNSSNTWRFKFLWWLDSATCNCAKKPIARALTRRALL